MKKPVLKYVIPAALGILCVLAVLFAAKAPGETAVETAVSTETTVPVESSTEVTQESPLPPLPSSLLYYGRVEEILTSEEGQVLSLSLSSERYGEYIMHLSQETVWIDSGERTVSDPATLTVGEGVYIFHSPVTALSLPPQSAAFALVRNIPQDAQTAFYLTVDAIETKDGVMTVTASNGTETFTVDENTTFSPYRTRNIVRAEDLTEGSRVMVWYDAARQEKPLRADHVMILPGTVES